MQFHKMRILLSSITIILSIGFLFPITAFAAHLITITPTSPFPSEVAASSITTATYTVTNRASKISLTVIDQTRFPSGSGLSILSSTCGTLLSPGQSCVLTLQLQAPPTPQTISFELREWAKPSADGVRLPIVITIQESPTLLVAAGQDLTSSQPPLLAISTSGGSTWKGETITNLPPSGSFNGASCTGSGASAICTVAGFQFTNNITIPFLVVTVNGGKTWEIKPIANSPTSGFFSAASCTGNGAGAICIAAGLNGISGQPPLLVASTDGGNTWGVKNIANLPTSGFFNAASCTGNGVSAICTAAGLNASGLFPPLLAVSTDGGNTWGVENIVNLPTSGIFNGTSCTGSGANAICTAVGQDLSSLTNQPPLLVISTNGGNTWGVKTIPNSPTSGVFNAISCTGSGIEAICTAVGQDLSSLINQPPLLAVSTDGGITWGVKNISNLPTSGVFNAVSCTGGNGANAICTAAGQDLSSLINQPPFLAVSMNGGNTWEIKNITDLPLSGVFKAASCTSSNSVAICIAAGQDLTGDQPPLLVVSIDSGNTWAIKTIAHFTLSGIFNGTGATGGVLGSFFPNLMVWIHHFKYTS